MTGISRHIDKVVRYAFRIILAVWILAQIIIILKTQDIPQFAEAEGYLRIAKDYAANNVIYPTRDYIENYSAASGYPTYIVYPGYINLLILTYKLFGTFKAIFWLNLLFNCITAASIYYIAINLKGRKFGRIALLLFCLYPLPVMMVSTSLTEIPSISLIYLSLALASRRNYVLIFLSALLIALAIYVRSVAFLFVLALTVYMIIAKFRPSIIVTYIVTVTMSCGGIMAVHEYRTGYRFLSANTLGVNMVMGANDGAYGPYNVPVGTDSLIDARIEGKNSFQIDSIKTAFALNWIKQHPARWSLLAFPKIGYQLQPKSYSNFGRDDEIIRNQNSVDKAAILGFKIENFTYQWVLLIFAFYGMWLRRKQLLGADGAILLPFIGGLALAVLTVGHPRYNMPYVPILIYFAIFTLYSIKRNFENRLSRR